MINNPSEMLLFPDLVATICGDVCVWLDKRTHARIHCRGISGKSSHSY